MQSKVASPLTFSRGPHGVYVSWRNAGVTYIPDDIWDGIVAFCSKGDESPSENPETELVYIDKHGYLRVPGQGAAPEEAGRGGGDILGRDSDVDLGGDTRSGDSEVRQSPPAINNQAPAEGDEGTEEASILHTASSPHSAGVSEGHNLSVWDKERQAWVPVSRRLHGNNRQLLLPLPE